MPQDRRGRRRGDPSGADPVGFRGRAPVVDTSLMEPRTPPGTTVSLLLSCHPLPAAAVTAGLTLAGAVTGRGAPQCALVAATVFTGQLTIGWVNDLVDADRDRRTGRADKPVALGWVDARTVKVATACTTLLVVPLSLANGTAAGVAHLGFVASGWAYDLHLKRTVLSWVPYLVGFGLLPAFVSYGGLGPGAHGSPPTVAVTVSVALLAVGVHFLNTLPDLDDDEEMAVRHLPLLVARRIGRRRLAWVSGVYTGAAAVAAVTAALRGGVRQ
jgi:4-hydroxybenzoate polyprenyltransferase